MRWSMKRALVLPLFVVVACASPSRADTPSPSGQFDPCVLACPAGDVTFRAIFNDFTGHPMAFPDAVLGFESCPNVRLEQSNPPGQYQIQPPKMLRKTGTIDGLAEFPIGGGGTCVGQLVRVYGSGALFTTRSFSSFDQNGDMIVDDGDLAQISSKIGT